MTKTQYRELRSEMGTQGEVAEMLGVRREAISNRERQHSEVEITTEMALALIALRINHSPRLTHEQQGELIGQEVGQ